MKADQVNGILTGTKNVLENHLGFSVIPGKPTIHKTPVFSGQISVIVGMTGVLSGELVLSMNMTLCKAIISKMFGREIEYVDEMGWSAFSEFGNWIGASCCTELMNKGYQVNIIPPIINEGKGKFRSVNNFISLSFNFAGEDMYVHVSVKET